MTTVFIVSTSIAIGFSFLCSLAEALLLSLNPITLNRLATTHPRAAANWRKLKSNIARPITAILVLNTISHTGGATVAGGAFAELYGERNIWIFSVLFTIVVLFGTEILPKIIGVTFRDRLAPVAGPILQGLTVVLMPVIWLSEKMFQRLTREKESDQITTADLVTFASMAKSGKAISLEQENIIVNALRLNHTLVGHVMIPIDRIRFVRASDQPEEVVALARRTGHTRYPVSRTDDPRDLHAYLVIKNALPSSGAESSALLAGARPIKTVKRGETIMNALRTMITQKEHLLGVSGDDGRCVGILTLEDITGELISADIDGFR
jgi:CBS domain containing-hemolysin-like protein